MFMSMLRTVVQSFDHFDDVVYHLQLLARRHIAYGTRPKHYDTVGRALLSALEKPWAPNTITRSRRPGKRRIP
jgi:nitric oxide dioxygenase